MSPHSRAQTLVSFFGQNISSLTNPDTRKKLFYLAQTTHIRFISDPAEYFTWNRKTGDVCYNAWLNRNVIQV